MRRGRIFLAVCVVACVFAASAAADWAGSDPKSNFVPTTVICTSPTACVNAGVGLLDQARASLGEPAYKLPADFPSLSGAEQMFILTNLDRIQYGLPPVTGLTAALDNDALVSGVDAQADPTPSSTTGLNTWTSNWAGGYDNVPLAYLAWMYDDGPGSSNLDCTATDMSGCWGHRHDILWKFPASDVLAMGAAVGSGPGSVEGYAMLIVGGDSGFTPTYSYTWAQAVADGAGTNGYDPGSGSPPPACVVPKLVGRKLTAAKHALTAAHCRPAVARRYSRYRAGLVIAQKPAPGKRLAKGSAVRIVVSRGPRR